MNIVNYYRIMIQKLFFQKLDVTHFYLIIFNWIGIINIILL